MRRYLNSITFGALAGTILGIAVLGTMFASYATVDHVLSDPAPYADVTNYGLPLTPVPEFVDEPQYVPTYTPVPPTPTPAPPPLAPLPSGAVAASAAGLDMESCYTNPERYEWKKWALIVGFPEHVVNSEEMAHIIQAESHGDLCARNVNSGAICWIQQYPGSVAFLDPYTCMSQGYSKYRDGARNYPDRSPWWQHWYQWWGR